jgi:uncharacterized protein (TIGR03437 family)
MRSLILVCLGVSICSAQATSSNPTVVGAGFSNPVPLPVAPGQLLTLFVQSGTLTDPTVPLPDVSATFWNGPADEAMPILEVAEATPSCSVSSSPGCPSLLAVTVQIPFDAPVSPLNSNILLRPNALAVSVNGVKTSYVGAQAYADQIHIVTGCDVLATPSVPSGLGLPCPPIIAHSDGTAVSMSSPAMAGEELVAYATGLGQTNPALTTGQPAPASNPAVSTFYTDFNYRANALATRPLPTAAVPLFAGSTQGFIGLYQINFIVPPPPVGTPPCAASGVIPQIVNGVVSNLTVSFGSLYSFDGAGICVQPQPVLDPPAAR